MNAMHAISFAAAVGAGIVSINEKSYFLAVVCAFNVFFGCWA